MKREALDPEALSQALATLQGWSLREGKLHRELAFPDFTRAFGFMSSMALVSEALNHHPEWHNVYGQVVIDLRTHDAQAVTALDVEWARRAEALLAARGG